MCYTGSMAGRVAIRQLRQNLSVYLRRVQAGESLEVTDRGRPVALLTPLPQTNAERASLIARELIARPATRPLRSAAERADGMSTQQALDEQRADRE
jgi:prevent-host-death family protein